MLYSSRFLGSNSKGGGLIENENTGTIATAPSGMLSSSWWSLTSSLTFGSTPASLPLPIPPVVPRTCISQRGWTAFVRFYQHGQKHQHQHHHTQIEIDMNHEPTQGGGGGDDDELLLLYVDDLEREHNYCTHAADKKKMKKAGGRTSPSPPIQWLLYCPKYNYNLHHYENADKDTDTVIDRAIDTTTDRDKDRDRDKDKDRDAEDEAIVSSSLLLSSSSSSSSSPWPPYVNSFKLEALLLSLPIPLEANTSAILASASSSVS
jgi:hypothetical protein